MRGFGEGNLVDVVWQHLNAVPYLLRGVHCAMKAVLQRHVSDSQHRGSHEIGQEHKNGGVGVGCAACMYVCIWGFSLWQMFLGMSLFAGKVEREGEGAGEQHEALPSANGEKEREEGGE